MKKRKESIIMWIIVIWVLLSLILAPITINVHMKDATKIKNQQSEINTAIDNTVKLGESLVKTNEANEELKKDNASLKEEIERRNKRINVGSRSGTRISPTISDGVTPTHIVDPIEVTEAEFNLLCKVIYAEATENPSLKELDYLLVGNVILNRVYAIPNGVYNKTTNLGTTIKNVIYRPGQYNSVGNDKFRRAPNEYTKAIVRRLIAGERFCPVDVVWQSQGRQGSKNFARVGVHYFDHK